MELDELKRVWKRQKVKESEYLSKEQLVLMLNNKIISFDENIKKRDQREIGTAVIMSLICGVLLFTLGSIWFKLGCVTIILACTLIIFKLHSARKINQKDILNPEISFKEHLHNELQKVEAQKKLLKNVIWWYLTPLFLAYLLFVLGFNFYWFIIAFFIVIGLILYGYLWKLNQNAVSKYLDPMIDDIKNGIKFVENPEN